MVNPPATLANKIDDEINAILNKISLARTNQQITNKTLIQQ